MADDTDRGLLHPEFRSAVSAFFSKEAIPVYQSFSAIGAFVLIFFVSWIYTIVDWGWFLGISLGWIPSAILSAMGGFVAYHIWFISLPVLSATYIAIFLEVLVLFGPPRLSQKADGMLSALVSVVIGQSDSP